jgi:hypothetical protein
VLLRRLAGHHEGKDEIDVLAVGASKSAGVARVMSTPQGSSQSRRRQWGMAMPSPRAVLPSFSRASMPATSSAG